MRALLVAMTGAAIICSAVALGWYMRWRGEKFTAREATPFLVPLLVFWVAVWGLGYPYLTAFAPWCVRPFDVKALYGSGITYVLVFMILYAATADLPRIQKVCIVMMYVALGTVFATILWRLVLAIVRLLSGG